VIEKNAEEEQRSLSREPSPVAGSLESDPPEADAPDADAPGADAPEADLPEADAPVADEIGDVVQDGPNLDRDGEAETPPARARVPRLRERSPSRRTVIREGRRRRSTSRRKRKRTFYGILGGIVAGTLILGLALPSFSGLITPSRTQSGDTTGDIATVGTAIAVQASSVLAEGESYTSYPSVPPTSGPSYAAGVEWGIYSEQRADEAVVRNLEQGAVVINHNLADEAQIADLTSYLEAQPGYPGCFILQPHAGVAEGTVTLTSWGWMETYTGVDRPGMQQFVGDHRNNAPQFLGQTCGADTTLPEAAPVGLSGN
jgi:hypothetical protein